MREDSLLNPTIETNEEVTLRPKHLDEFIGQDRVRERLEISLEAARKEKRPLDHLLFAGPPGLGKTTLAGIVATEMGVQLHDHLRPGARAGRRPRRDPHQARRRRRAVHRRDPPPVAAPSRRSSTRRWRTSSSTSWSARARRRRVDPARPAAVHARRRHHPHGHDHRRRCATASGSSPGSTTTTPDELAVIIRRSAGILGVEIAEDRGREIARRSRRRRASPTACCRVRDFAGRGPQWCHRRPRSPTRPSRCSGSTTSVSTRSTGRSSSAHRQVRRRAGRAVDAGHRRR